MKTKYFDLSVGKKKSLEQNSSETNPSPHTWYMVCCSYHVLQGSEEIICLMKCSGSVKIQVRNNK